MKFVKILHTLLTFLTIFIAFVTLLGWIQLQFLLGSDPPFDYGREFSKNFYHIYFTLPFLILFQLNIIGTWHKIAKYVNTILIILLLIVLLEVSFASAKWNSLWAIIFYLPFPTLLLFTTIILRKDA